MPISNDTAPLAQFLAGQAVRAQEFLGSHPTVRGGQSGWLFRVWAPHAQAVAVMGDFNGWDDGANPMAALEGGVWAVSYTHLDVYKRQHQLSGGQQQRVAIARALALSPDILCFDEPTSALDPELTGEVLRVIRALAEQKTTMIIVTHEMAFARDVADQVVFMDGGVIVEQGDARQVIEHPREERTRQFLARYSEN